MTHMTIKKTMLESISRFKSSKVTCSARRG